MKQKEEKYEYGRAVACRLTVEDYDYFVGIAKARSMKRSELLEQIIIDSLNSFKKVEKEYAKDIK